MIEISRDTLWKGIIEDLFSDFLYYFFPTWAENEVNFEIPFEFLDKELDEIYPSEDGKNRRADKLVKVFTKSGEEKWILVHVEVQNYKDADFSERMFTYFYRIRDRWGVNILALAIYADANAEFHPSFYEYEYQNTKIRYDFNVFDLLLKSENELNIANNPFSMAMLMAKKVLGKSKISDENQFRLKMEFVRKLQQANFSHQTILNVLNFIRYYVKFKNESVLNQLDTEIQTSFKQRKRMGIQEAILHEAKEQGVEEGKKLGLERGKKLGLERGKKLGLEEGELKANIQNIQNILAESMLSLEQIAKVFKVEIQFVQAIQDGKIYIDESGNIINSTK